MNHLAIIADDPVPALVAAAGDRAAYRFLEFFTAQIRNPHTRRAYAWAVAQFCDWLDGYGLPSITAVSSIHVAAYIEKIGRVRSAPTVKQRLAAIRMLFDWLATGGVLPFNPAIAVRGPKQVVKRGKTPVLAPDEARAYNAGIPFSTAPNPAARPFRFAGSAEDRARALDCRHYRINWHFVYAGKLDAGKTAVERVALEMHMRCR